MNKSKSNKDCIKLFGLIYENIDSFKNEFIPEGWRNSNYAQFLNPTAQQLFDEYIQWNSTPNSFESDEKKVIKLKTIKEFKQNNLNKIDEDYEFHYIFGLALFDIFSSENEVIDSNNKNYDLGSHRGSGSFIANYINFNYPQNEEFDYLDFYLSPRIRERGSFWDLYKFIFKTLKTNNCDWVYFPYGIDLEKMENEFKLNFQIIESKGVNGIVKTRKVEFEENIDQIEKSKLNDLLKAYFFTYEKMPLIIDQHF